MIDGIEFSDRGRAITDFEMRMLAESQSDAAWVTLAQRLMLALGPKAGCQAFALVLDELGGIHLRVPLRRDFFRGLWSQARDAMIVDLASRPTGGWSYAEIGRMLGVSREYVRKVVARQPDGATVDGPAR